MNEKINYTIINFSDERRRFVDDIKKKLSGWNFIEGIEFVDGKSCDPFEILNSMNIRTDCYAPDDGRTFKMLDTEAGCFVSHIACLKKIRAEGLSSLLVFEDDCALSDDFIEIFYSALTDTPKDFDFLSLFSVEEQNQLSTSSDIGSKVIHKCISQLSGNVAMLYSNEGAKKILKMARREGTKYNIDSIIYRKSKKGDINGYIVLPELKKIVEHRGGLSLIDPDGIR